MPKPERDAVSAGLPAMVPSPFGSNYQQRPSAGNPVPTPAGQLRGAALPPQPTADAATAQLAKLQAEIRSELVDLADERIAAALTERDDEIAALKKTVTALGKKLTAATKKAKG